MCGYTAGKEEFCGDILRKENFYGFDLECLDDYTVGRKIFMTILYEGKRFLMAVLWGRKRAFTFMLWEGKIIIAILWDKKFLMTKLWEERIYSYNLRREKAGYGYTVEREDFYWLYCKGRNFCGYTVRRKFLIVISDFGDL